MNGGGACGPAATSKMMGTADIRPFPCLAIMANDRSSGLPSSFLRRGPRPVLVRMQTGPASLSYVRCWPEASGTGPLAEFR